MDDSDESGAGAAERAFQALTTEVSGTRQAVLALKATWDTHPPVDTTETLGVIVSRLNVVAQQLAEIEKHPALRLTPAQHAQAVAAAGEGLLRTAAQKLDVATRDAETARRELVGLIGSTRGQREQWRWLGWTAAVALLLGLFLSPMFARLLPFGADGYVAAFILRADRWNAGAALMEAASPAAWRDLESAAALLMPNKTILTVCRDAAMKAKKDQRCLVIVPPT